MRQSAYKLNDTLSPIYFGNPLIIFVTEKQERFGPLDPIKWKGTGVFGDSLMSQLPLLSKGFVLQTSWTSLFTIYLICNGLEEPENSAFCHFDDFMTKVFIDTSATFYVEYYGRIRIPMEEAIRRGLLTEPISTQNVIRISNPEFNTDMTAICRMSKIDPSNPSDWLYREAFACSNFMRFLFINSFYEEDMVGNAEYVDIWNFLQQSDTKEQLIKESHTIDQTLSEWLEYKRTLINWQLFRMTNKPVFVTDPQNTGF